MIEKIRIGTRKSLLAQAQTRIVAEKIKEIAPEVTIEILPINTEGDLRLDKSLGSFGGKGVFTKELEQALLDGRIHMAVHSAKDMPMDFPEGLGIGAVVERAEWEDVIVTRDGKPLKAMAPGTVIGTGSLRRSLQLKILNPKIQTKEIRGNVQTRLRKLEEGSYDAIVLARAGLERLRRDAQKYAEAEEKKADFYDRFHYEILNSDEFLPAAGQAILAVEISEKSMEDADFAKICRKLNDKKAEGQLLAERSFLRYIGGGCNAPVCAFSWPEGNRFYMKGGFARDGRHMIFDEVQGDRTALEKLGEKLAKKLKTGGSRCTESVQSDSHGKVFLVGAGPGDAGLVTVKGLWCIRHADVIVYDYLASDALLNEAGENAELIYAGKQSGHHHMFQEDIQKILLEKALEGKTVVRLKGGDPFIFGRGGEEALALSAADIPFEIVPGVSSAYSVPAYAGIPVTHRGIASQVHFITGHEQVKAASDIDYGALAASGGTLVFLMGIKRLAEICEALIQHGKDKNTPAAVIRNGTTGSQKEVIATLETIAGTCKEADIKPPGILVVGEVAGLSEKIGWRQKQPLTGKQVLLTGTRELVRKQHRSLLTKGAESIDMSLIYTEPAADEILEAALRDLTAYSWLIFTSSNGVKLFFESMKKFGVDYRKAAHLKFAVVGPGTGDMLKDYGFHADFMPESYTSEALAEGLAGQMNCSQKVLVFRAKEGSKSLNQCFQIKGIHYTDVAAYATRADWRKQDLLLRAMKDADYMTFASGSAVRAFAEMTVGVTEYPKIVCIGPVTAREAKKAGLTVCATAENYTIEGLTECLCQLQNRE